MIRQQLLVFLFCHLCFFVSKSEGQSYWAVEQEGAYTFVDSAGHLLYKPQFAHAISFSEGLGAIRLANDTNNSRWYFINERLEIVIKTGFYEVKPFSEGLAAVRTRWGWNFIDKQGQLVIKGDYEEVGSFKNGFARVKMNNRWALINKDQVMVMPPNFSYLGDYHERLVAAQYPGSDFMMVLTLAGDTVINDSLSYVGYFASGMVPVIKQGKTFYLNALGKVALYDEDFLELSEFNQGWACVKMKYGSESNWYFLHHGGILLHDFPMASRPSFENGAWLVQNAEGGKNWYQLNKAPLLKHPGISYKPFNQFSKRIW